MSNWPEPTHDESEPPRWGKWAAAAVIAAAAAMLATSGGDRWRMPALSMPEMPDFSSPTLGQVAPGEETPSAVAAISEDAIPSPREPPTESPDGATVQSMPFDACLSTLGNLTNSLGQPATIIEDTADRRVAAFKFLDSDMRVTCDRAEGTMSVQRR